MGNSTLEIVIKARDEASTAVKGVSSSLKSLEPQFKQMAAVGTVAFTAIAAVAVSSFKAYADAEAQMVVTNKSLENSLDSISGAALTNLQKELGTTTDVLGSLKKSAEDAGKAAIKMGFDDETAARSFAKLFAVTKDVTQANKEMQAAMDLARFKNISLEEATQKLIMVHSGATKELKALGLAVDEGATSMQNIDSIMRQTTGTASEFSKTAQGAMEVAKVSADNLKESIGGALAPVFDTLREKLVPIVQKFVDWAEQNPETVKWIIIITGAIAGLVAILGILGLILPPIIAGFTLLLSPIGLVILAVMALVALVALIIAKWTPIKAFFEKVWNDIKTVFQNAIAAVMAFFQPLIDLVQSLIDKIEKVAASIGKVIGAVGGAVKNAASAVGDAASNVASNVAAGWKSITGQRAQGGNVSRGSSYLVGENGAEIFTPTTGGSIMPNNQLAGAGMGVVVNITGGNFLGDAEEMANMLGDSIVRQLKRVSRIG